MPDLSIVIPVFNEAANIDKAIRTLPETIRANSEILIVYDSDDDNTVPVAQQLIPEFPQVRLIRNYIYPSASGAIRTGILEAKTGRVLVMMADLCDDVHQIEHLLSLVPERADIACPSRYCKGGKQLLKSIKVWYPRTASYFLNLMTGIPTLDATNSFKLYSMRVLRDFPLKSTVSFSVTLEIVVKAFCLGYRIVEVPTIWRDREQGKSNFKIGRSIPAYLQWVGLALMRGRVFRVPRSWIRSWIGASTPSIEGNRQGAPYV